MSVCFSQEGGRAVSNENFDRQYRLAAGKAGGMGFEIGETSKSQPVPLHINFSGT